MDSGHSLLVGYVDSVHGYTSTYPDPILFAARPIHYRDVIIDTFSSTFASSGYSTHGSGISSLEADAYGTLLLPTGNYHNTLRIKITQTEHDTSSFNQVSSTTTVSYVWFDTAHTSALLKIDSTYSSGNTFKSVEYLQIEHLPTTGISDVHLNNAIRIYPNPARELFNIDAPESGQLTLYDVTGRTITMQDVTTGTNHINAADLPDGIYTAQIINSHTSYTSRIQILH